MLRSVAVQRINDDLGFRPDGHSLEAKIILRLQEAQRDLEKGKTLPRFLLQEDQTLTLAAAAHTVALPTGFLREADDSVIHYTPEGTDLPYFLERKYYRDGVLALLTPDSEAVAPAIYVVRNTVIDFITTADQAYTLTWDYYKKGDPLTSDVENVWLDDDNMPEYLIGEAGYRMAKSLRDQVAMQSFDDMRKQARLAMFSEEVAAELASGPVRMGANL